MTSIYLAGKIGQNDWRHDIVRGLRGAWGSDGEEPDPYWPVLRGAVSGMDYVGPYFMSDDHGCGHGEGTHGCGPDEEGMCGGAYDTPGRSRVRDLCLGAIFRADIVFAWLGDRTAYGTLVELGYAAALRKKLIIAAPSLPSGPNVMHGGSYPNEADELWFAFSLAHHVIRATTPSDALAEIAAPLVQLESPIEQAFWAAYIDTRPPALSGLVPQFNVCGGRYRLDFALPSDRVGIELDGYEYHSSKEAFTKDRERQRQIEATGWRIIRFSGSEVHGNAAACVRQAAGLVAAFKTQSDENAA